MASFFKKFMKEVEKFTNADEQNNASESEPLTNKTEEETADEQEEYNEPETEYDPETLHGTHYTEEEFEEKVKELSEEWIAREKADGEMLSQEDIDNIYWNYRRDVYRAWNNPTENQLLRWQDKNSLKYTGIASFGADIDEENNPLLEPVHGLSLKDYAAVCAAMANGTNEDKVFKAFGIDKAIFDELNIIWPKRMAEDGSFSISTLFGKYFGEGPSHPSLQGLGNDNPSANNENLERLKTDIYFYEELNGARQAAYQYGIDGAKWIEDNFGISLGDFQSVAMQWAMENQKNWDTEKIKHYFEYQQQKEKEYAEKFAKEMGGNIADDVDF